jgi:hypothetical protein
MTGPVVNLARARKAKAKAQDKAQADANAARFGLTKAERVLNASREARARAKLDQHKLDEE